MFHLQEYFNQSINQSVGQSIREARNRQETSQVLFVYHSGKTQASMRSEASEVNDISDVRKFRIICG